MHLPPYVRNAPLFKEGDHGDHGTIRIVGSGQEALELRATNWHTADISGVGRRVITAWNFHDPLVDALTALTEEPANPDVLIQAKLVLEALRDYGDTTANVNSTFDAALAIGKASAQSRGPASSAD